MFLGLITLLTALTISGIAAFYSIVGLTAIFAGAFWPIVIMGGALEMGKVVTALWLHYNWENATYKLKVYLVPAVVILMLITSMGIFGFLSKSHLDQGVPTGDIQSQVSLFDEKIQTQRDNIDSARKALTQLNGAVDQLLSRSTDVNGASKAAALRRSQAKERSTLQTDIDAAQKQITTLQEERAPIASKMRKVEAEVGPIRYIAALIYGDSATQNVLESAVRWVIIIIVMVFDPLAIVLILAATTSIDWAKAKKLVAREKKEHTLEDEKLAALLAQKEIEYEHKLNTEIKALTDKHEANSLDADSVANLVSTATASVAAANSELTSVINEMKNGNENLQEVYTQERELSVNLREELAALSNSSTLLEQRNADLVTELKNAAQLIEELAAKKVQENAYHERVELANALLQDIASEETFQNGYLLPPVIEEPVIEEPVIAGTLNTDTGVVEFAVTEPEVKHVVEDPVLETLPEEPVNTANFGITFPSNPVKGDLFLRVDYNPNKLFKYVGGKWIETNKLATDAYAYSEEYIKLLVAQIGSGETDIDDCTPTEQAQIAEYLEKTAVTKE
jgi:hypothetical protein